MALPFWLFGRLWSSTDTSRRMWGDPTHDLIAVVAASSICINGSSCIGILFIVGTYFIVAS